MTRTTRLDTLDLEEDSGESDGTTRPEANPTTSMDQPRLDHESIIQLLLKSEEETAYSQH